MALGYGQGNLRYEVTRPAAAAGTSRRPLGQAAFDALRPGTPVLLGDGLPADAWMPFLGGRTGMLSTRDDVRPFTPEEQRRILRVGACLTCHAGDSAVMRESVRDFDALLARRSRRCVLPAW